ncbi:MAG: penicillin-binding protein family [Gemmatimonadetes bacterium]|nr:penicillin-binding protein family [Gemmatimonadota bacterium]
MNQDVTHTPPEVLSQPQSHRPTLVRGLASALTFAFSCVPLAARAQEGGIELLAPTQSAQVYARDGSLIAELGPQVRTIVSIRSLPEYVPRTFVAVEDRRFYEHPGVDPIGVARAIGRTLSGRREGASTITQQLVGTMYPHEVDRREMTVGRKLREMELAVELEQRYPKDRILESYLNWISFGHGWFGIEAAARHFFGKPAAKLSIEETAMLAALPKGPGIYSPKINMVRARERRDLVLGIMAQAGIITPAQAAQARARPIRLAPNHGYSARPSWAVEQVRQYLEQSYGHSYGTVGLRVWTSIDPAVQNAADSALVRGLRRIEAQRWFRGPRFGSPTAKPDARGTPYLQGLVVSVDAKTGEILAMVGGRDFTDSHFNRVTSARRQPGSAFKPIVYTAALEHGFTAATVMEDTALSIAMRGQRPYQPRNSDNVFRGPVSVREGLVQSINTVAIQLGLETGIDTVLATARRFGIESPIHPYPSSLIGAGAVKPLELAAAYTAFAYRGVRVEPFLIRRVSDLRGRILFDRGSRGVRVLSPEVAWLMTDLMRDAAERGTGREARRRLPARVPMAGKTGTTDDATDTWYVGFTPEMVTAVWVGFDTPRPLGSVAFGGTTAAPIWGDVMGQVYARRPPPAPWAVPPGVVTVAIDRASGLPALEPCPAAPAAQEKMLAAAVPAGSCYLHPDGTWRADALPAAAPVPTDSVVHDTLPAIPPPGAALTRPL